MDRSFLGFFFSRFPSIKSGTKVIDCITSLAQDISRLLATLTTPAVKSDRLILLKR